jgi:phosphohistidine phosphatase
MKTLLILRHAKSSWKKPGLTDYDRPLNKRGKLDAPRMGELIREKALVPDLIISSSAKRACQTADRVAQACGYRNEVRLEDDLYLAYPDVIVRILKLLLDGLNSVMVVGHNPGVEELLRLSTGHEEVMPTAALAHIILPIRSWSEMNSQATGELVHLWRPKELA